MKSAPIILVLALLLAGFFATVSRGQPAAGGFRNIPVTDKKVMAAAKFAVEAKSKKEKIVLVKVLKAEAQVVAGMNYRLGLEVGVEGGTRPAEAVVWAKLDGSYELTRWDWKGDVRPADKDTQAPQVTAPADENQSNERAKGVVRKFLQTLKVRDVSGAMGLADVPWLNEKRGVLRSRKDLKGFLQSKVLKTDVSFDGFKIENIISPPEVRSKIEDKAFREHLDEVLGKDGRIVFLMQQKPIALRFVLVRLRARDAKVVGGPFKLTYLFTRKKMSAATTGVLEKAGSLELLSLEPNRRNNVKDGFHGWRVLGKTVVKDKKTREQLAAAVVMGVADNEGLAAACFNPRHGIRVTAAGKTVDFVICFECLQMQVFLGTDRSEDLLIAASPQALFDKVLHSAGVPLAKPRGE
jgi:Aspartic acid proteinase inhibitor